MNKVTVFIFLLFFLISGSFNKVKSQSNPDYWNMNAISVSGSDLVGGFLTLSYSSNFGLFMDHTDLSIGTLIFDGVLPEYNIGYIEPEPTFRKLKSGFTASISQSIHSNSIGRQKRVFGYKIRYVYQRNAIEFRSNVQFLITFGYHFYIEKRVLIYPSIQAGWAFYYSHQPQYNSYWDKQNGIIGGLSLNMGYVF